MCGEAICWFRQTGETIGIPQQLGTGARARLRLGCTDLAGSMAMGVSLATRAGVALARRCGSMWIFNDIFPGLQVPDSAARPRGKKEGHGQHSHFLPDPEHAIYLSLP